MVVVLLGLVVVPSVGTADGLFDETCVGRPLGFDVKPPIGNSDVLSDGIPVTVNVVGAVVGI